MDFTSKTFTTADFTFEQALQVILAHPLCDPIIKHSYPHVTGGVVQGLTYATALQIFRTESKRQTTGSGHPTVVLVSHATEHTIRVTPGAIVVNAKKPVTLKYRRGYFVDAVHDKVSRVIAAKAHTADMLAYTFTPNTPIDASHTCDSNFSKDQTSIGIPLVPGSRKMADTFKTRDAAGNGYKIFQQLQTQTNWVWGLQAVEPLTASLVSQGHDAQTLSKIGPTAVKIPKPYAPVPKACGSADLAYKVLDRHRGARGEDKKWLSPLTSGYYVGAMPRAIEEVWWRAADIFHVAVSMSARNLVLGPGLGLNLARTLAANGLIVFYVANAAIDFLTEEDRVKQIQSLSIGAGACLPYSVTDAGKVLEQAELYVDVGLKAATTFANKIVTETAAWNKSIASLITRQFNWMTWWGVTPEILKRAKQEKLGVEYSVHAHSGQALFIRMTKGPASWTADTSYAESRYYGRMVTANVYKTHFPFSRTRFLEVDVQKYKFQNLAVAGLTLNLAITRKQKVELKLLDDDASVPDVEDEGDIDFGTYEVDQSVQASDLAFVVPPSVPTFVAPVAPSPALVQFVSTMQTGPFDGPLDNFDTTTVEELTLEDDATLYDC